MNKSWSVSRSENTKNRLIKDPSEWYYYHSLYAEKRKEWSEIPYIEIAKKIKERPEWIVADMGCGENLLSKELTVLQKLNKENKEKREKKNRKKHEKNISK